MKSNLYIVGDSWVSYKLPAIHWTANLSKEFNVVNLGNPGFSNQQILTRLFEIPNYNKGDRLIIVLTEFSRLNCRDTRLFREFIKSNFFGKKYLKLFKYEVFPNALSLERHWHFNEDSKKIRSLVDYFQNLSLTPKTYSSMPSSSSIINIKNLYFKDFNPVFFTWNKNTKEWADYNNLDFIHFKEVSSLHEEGIAQEDHHPGQQGCSDLTDFFLELLRSDKGLINTLN